LRRFVMECVKSVDEFARRNSDDLKKFMIYKTGIHDTDLIRDTIQEFFVKLIESRALETYDPAKGTFKTYIMNLFCWLLPVMAKKNKSVKYTFVSHVKDRDRHHQWYGRYTDVFEGMSGKSDGPYADNAVDTCYDASHVREAEELEAERSLNSFVKFVQNTQPPSVAERIVPFVQYREQGCNGADIAKMLGLSNSLMKTVRERAGNSYEEWRGYKMTPGKKAQKQTLDSVVAEIKLVQGMITRYNAGDVSLPMGFSYKEAVLRLRYLRTRQSQLGRRDRGHRREE